MQKLLFVMLLSLCHCGYNWGHQDRSLPGGHRTVYVEMFENLSQEPGVEHNFTQALKTELSRSGLAVVTSKESAELIIQGSIVSLTHSGSGSIASFRAQDFANGTARNFPASYFTNYNLLINANLKAIRSRDKQLIWQTSVAGRDVYRGSLLKRQGTRNSNVLYNQSRKKQTIKLMAQKMMTEAFDRLTENF